MPASWTPNTVLGTQGFTPITSGTGVASPNMPPDLNGQLANGANALLQTGAFANGLWIHTVQSDFTLDGEFVQAALVRDWYPHNLGVPMLKFSGQTPNNYEKNRLAQFVRQSHIWAVRDATDSGTETLQLTMAASVGWENDYPVGGHKGPHGIIDIKGYIDGFQFGADRFKTAYEYTFDFVIVKTLHWLGLEDELATQIPLSNINQKFQSVAATSTKTPTKTGKKTPSSATLKIVTGGINTAAAAIGNLNLSNIL
jgi:hypothetical protein